jgi:quinol monooxygenase YgiN
MENQKPIHVFATWKIKEGQIDTVLYLLKTVHAETIKEEGNLFYKIHQSNSDVNTLVLFEGYANEDSVAQHRESVHYQDVVAQQIVPLLENREVFVTTPLEY